MEDEGDAAVTVSFCARFSRATESGIATGIISRRKVQSSLEATRVPDEKVSSQPVEGEVESQ